MNYFLKFILGVIITIIAIIIVINLVIGTCFMISSTKRANDFINNSSLSNQVECTFVN